MFRIRLLLLIVGEDSSGFDLYFITKTIYCHISQQSKLLEILYNSTSRFIMLYSKVPEIHDWFTRSKPRFRHTSPALTSAPASVPAPASTSDYCSHHKIIVLSERLITSGQVSLKMRHRAWLSHVIKHLNYKFGRRRTILSISLRLFSLRTV